MSRLSRVKRISLAAVATLGMAACSDGFFHDPAPAGSVHLAIVASQADGATTAFDKADNVDLRVEDRSSGRSIFEATPRVSAAGGAIQVPIEIDLRNQGKLRGQVDARVVIQVRRSGDALFEGEADLELVAGRSSEVSISLTPVAQSLEVPVIPSFTAFNETVELGGAVLFATGDPIPGAELQWVSKNPLVLLVEPAPGGGYQARSIADGEGRLEAAFGSRSEVVDAIVRAKVVRAEIEPSSATLAPGESEALEVLLFDRNDSPVPGRTSEWTSSDESIVTVSGTGLVLAVSEGTADVTATHEGVFAVSTISVRDPAPRVSAPRTGSISVSGATVTATVDPRGLTTTVWFEYGLDPNLTDGVLTTSIEISGTAGPTEVSKLLSGLLDNTTYYVRTIAVNAQGRTTGEIVSFTTLDAPDAPSGLTATLASGAVLLTWVDNSGSETRFEIQRTPIGSGTGTIIASPGANAQQYTDGSPPSQSLEYRVRACNANGCSAWSDPAVITSPDLAPGVTTLTPSPITLTSATLRARVDARGFNTSVRFEWGTDPSLAGASLTTASLVPASSSVSTLTFPLTGLSANTTYYVRAFGVSTRGRADGDIVAFTTRDVPSAPSGLVATLGNYGGVRLTWIDGSTDETGFEVEREFVSTGTRTTLSAAAGAELLIDLAAPIGSLKYRVRACNAAGCSAWSATVSIVLPSSGPTVVTLAPQAVVADGATLRASVDPQGLTSDVWFLWATNAAMSGATQTATITIAGSASQGIVSQPVTGLAPSTTYFVRAVGVNAQGRTDGAVVSFTTPVLPPVPTGPTGLTVSASPGGGIQLDWTDNSSNETGFEIELVVSGGAPTTIGTAAGATQFVDDAPPTGLLEYRVRACNAGGCSAYTAPVQWYYGLPPVVTLAPTTNIGLVVADVNALVNPLNDATTVVFRVSTDAAFTNPIIAPATPIDAGAGAAPLAVSTTVTGLNDGLTYFVRVEATNRWGTTVSPTGTFTTAGG
jgi:hypothetical protein